MEMLEVEDLLIEILLRLPPTSCLRFQCVSKKWLSIISGPYFRRLHPSRLSATVTALFFAHPRPKREVNPLPYFVSLQLQHNEIPQYTQHSLTNRLTKLWGGGQPPLSLHSCNGLLCVRLWCRSNFCYVYNPTTNQHRRIPDPFPNKKRYSVLAMSIAFDPSKSHHYKLVCVFRDKRDETIGLSVFSSESRVWRKSGEKFPREYFISEPGAFLNGAIHWHWYDGHFLCFDVDNARLRPMPSIPLLQEYCVYFGECGGHLHCIEQLEDEDGNRSKLLIDVFEMKNDYSQWVIKYHVELNHPQVCTEFLIHLFVVDHEGKEGLVISLNCNLRLYNLHDKSITELAADSWREKCQRLLCYRTCKHIETLAYV